MLKCPNGDEDLSSLSRHPKHLGDGSGAALRRRQVMNDGDGNDGIKSGVAEGEGQGVGAEGIEPSLSGDGGKIEGAIATNFEERILWL